MAINGHRNKPIGPGGSTRRLHHQLTVSQLRSLTRNEGAIGRVTINHLGNHLGPANWVLWVGFSELLMGANQHRRRCKGCVFARHGSAVIGPSRIVANDNYAEVALAA